MWAPIGSLVSGRKSQLRGQNSQGLRCSKKIFGYTSRFSISTRRFFGNISTPKKSRIHPFTMKGSPGLVAWFALLYVLFGSMEPIHALNAPRLVGPAFIRRLNPPCAGFGRIGNGGFN